HEVSVRGQQDDLLQALRSRRDINGIEGDDHVGRTFLTLGDRTARKGFEARGLEGVAIAIVERIPIDALDEEFALLTRFVESAVFEPFHPFRYGSRELTARHAEHVVKIDQQRAFLASAEHWLS